MTKINKNVVNAELGEIAYICPDCNRIVRFKPLYNLNRVAIGVESELNNICIDKIALNYNVLCIECDTYMYECDEKLSERIVKLNNLGIHTLFCCEGHFITDIKYPFDISQNIHRNANEMVEISLPYISFRKCINKSILDIIKTLLSLQEYGFINIEDTYDENYGTRYTLRAVFDEGSIDMLDDSPINVHDIHQRFDDMQNAFFRFIDDLIRILETENYEAE